MKNSTPRPADDFERAQYGIDGSPPLDEPPVSSLAQGDNDTAPADPCAGIEPIDAAELIDQYPEMRPSIIEGVLRSREVMAFVSASKHGKTFLMMLLALSVATGRMFLGKFPVTRCKVLILDLELHRETLARRLAAVAREMGIARSEYSDWLKIVPMRGRLKTLDQMDLLIRRSEGYGLIVIDSLYRAWPDQLDENSNADVTKVFNRLDSWTDLTGAAIVAVHHASKGSQSSKAVVDVGSGAGAMARAVDSHLILRAHAEDDAAVLEGVARSWPPFAPLGLRWAYPCWHIADDIDPSNLLDARPRRRAAAAKPEREPPKTWTIAEFVAAAVTKEPKPKALVIAKARATIPTRQVDDLLLLAEESRAIHRWRGKNDREVLYSTEKPALFVESATEKGNSLTHTHAPPTPPRKRGRSGAGGRARARKTKNAASQPIEGAPANR
jgi:hypothetical protein